MPVVLLSSQVLRRLFSLSVFIYSRLPFATGLSLLPPRVPVRLNPPNCRKKISTTLRGFDKSIKIVYS